MSEHIEEPSDRGRWGATQDETRRRREAAFEVPAVPFHALLDESAARTSRHVAIRFDGGRLTFDELATQTHRAAHALAALGVRRGDRVALAFYDRPEYLVSLVALSRLGAVAVPVNPSLCSTEILHVLAHSGARVLVGNRTATARVRPAVEQALDPLELAKRMEAAPPRRAPEIQLDPAEDLLVLQYTSGTTGTPRAAMLTHRNVVASHLQYVRAGRVGPDDVSLIFVPCSHVYGTMLMGGAIAAGATQVLMERFDLEASLELVERHRVTLYYCTTAVVVQLMRSSAAARRDLSSLRYVNSGGAPLPDDVRREARSRLGVEIADGYGLTEAPIVGHRVPGEHRRVVPLEDPTRVCGPGEPGEIQVRGPQVMKGYWQDPEATARAFQDGWLRTGDLGYHDTSGRLHVTARAKEVIKYRGFAVSPAELEGLLLQHPAVQDCAVVGHASPDGDEAPCAYLVVRDSVQATDAVEHVNRQVAAYKRIRDVRVVSHIPRNGAGKVVKRLLT
jgi:long-chain acyl-CoA synthetase